MHWASRPCVDSGDELSLAKVSELAATKCSSTSTTFLICPVALMPERGSPETSDDQSVLGTLMSTTVHTPPHV
jgi:hypothetical protein